MESNGKLLAVLFLTFAAALLNPASGKTLTVSPQNEAVLAGDTVVLTCEVAQAPPNSRVMWAEFVTDAGGEIISDNEVILGHPNAARYSIIHTTETMFNLEIRNVQLSDGGRYVCEDTLAVFPDVEKGEAELIVIAAEPNCTTTAPADGNVIEGQNHTVECIVHYQGLYAPSMHWSGPPPFQVGNSPPNPASVWSGIGYTVNRTMDTRAFECLTNFTEIPSVPDYVADNIPSWEHLYRTPQIFVYWGPKNMYAEPIKAEYQVGDLITCYADAWPEPSYNWQNMRTLEIFQGQVFNVTEDMVGYNQQLRCQAQNLIQGFVYSANLFIMAYVPAPTTTTPGPTTPSTTTPPLESDCFNLTGHWVAENPFAEIIFEVQENSELGEIRGLVKRDGDTIWVEVIGTVRRSDWALVGVTSIWPFQEGITGFAAECHRCSGVEVLIMDGLWRSIYNSSECGVGSTPQQLNNPYTFSRQGTVKSALEGRKIPVHNPSEISRGLGVK